MNIMCWNCRGLGSFEAVRELNRIAKSCNPQILFLSETKLKEGEMERLKWRIGYECGIYVSCEGHGRARSGGVALLWKRSVLVVLLSFSLHHIDVEVRDTTSWRFTGLYGWPKTEERGNTWNLMKTLRDSSQLPWLCGGDINEIKGMDEKRGGNLVHHSRIEAYQEAVSFCKLRDMPQSGLKFTWSNGRPGENHVECKLDRYFANAEWWEIFSASYSEALPRIESDHSPILCRILKEPFRPRMESRFRFEEMWMKHENFSDQIVTAWKGCPVGISFRQRSLHCATVLKDWEKQVFGQVRKQLRELEEAILHEQSRPFTETSKQAIESLLKRREEIRAREEVMWLQRSRVSWLKEGDRNTKFFHKKASHRLQRNRIGEVKNGEGVLVQGEAEIQEVFRKFYVSLFSSTGSVRVESITSTVIPKITPEMKQSLTSPFTKEEIFKALQQMHPSKAPGPDGLPPIFFQRYWTIVEKEVLKTTLDILNEEADPSELNDTTIVLIPKGAFVPGRLISDNSLIAFEAYHYLKKKTKGKRGYCAMKLDMSKAYDRIEWNFLEAMLVALGFPSPFVNLIMRCVRTVRYAIQINGCLGDFFTPSRGLRQGDPISPYLFLLCVEGLAAIIQNAERLGIIHGLRVARSAPPITHLFFADDSLLFARASATELKSIMDILSLYEGASGQKINIQKCSLKFSRNVAEVDQHRLQSSLGMRLATDEERYLGLPTVIGRSKKEVFAKLEEQIRAKVENWRLRFLSKAGREVFIKSILQAIPTYIMSTFILPIEICERIEKRLGDIYWGSQQGERKLHWRSWARLCRPKQEGGLGFRKLKNFNNAMLAKQAWRLLSEPTSLTARIFKARYYPRSKLLEAGLGYSPSHVWRGIFEGLSLLKKGLEWRVGTGAEINIWNDSWLKDSPLGHPKYLYPGNDCFQIVAELWCSESLSWNEELLRLLFAEDDMARIKAIRLSPRLPRDTLRWKHTEDGCYSVRSGYRYDFSEWWNSEFQGNRQNIRREVWNSIWRMEGPPRLLTFLWRLMDNNIPVRENLKRRGIIEDSLCPLCNTHPETIEHLFMECPTSRRLLLPVGYNPVIQPRPSISLAWFELTQQKCSAECGRILAAMWGLWKVRNLFVFQDPNLGDIHREISKAISYYDDYVAASLRQSTQSSNGQTRWKRPPPDFIKINSDAAVVLNRGGQVSAVARDEHGTFIQAAVKSIPAVQHPTMLEAYGILLALDLAKKLLCPKVIIESDCLPIVLALQAGRRNKSDLDLLVEDCLEASKALEVVRFNFVKRSANNVAHLLAKEQYPSQDLVHFLVLPPCTITDALLYDVSNDV